MRYLILIALALSFGCVRKQQIDAERWIVTERDAYRCALSAAIIDRPDSDLAECFTHRGLVPPWAENTTD